MSYNPGEMPDDDPRAETIRAMIEDLGWCLNSYSQVEYLIGDLVWQAWDLPAYVALKQSAFPLVLENRIKALEVVLLADGPYRQHGYNLRGLITRLRQLSEPRHMFAHGHTAFARTPDGACFMIFRRFLPPHGKGGRVTKYEAAVRPETLRVARESWCRFASTAQRIIGAIYLDLGLEDPGI